MGALTAPCPAPSLVITATEEPQKAGDSRGTEDTATRSVAVRGAGRVLSRGCEEYGRMAVMMANTDGPLPTTLSVAGLRGCGLCTR
jgi:hypothetical protein